MGLISRLCDQWVQRKRARAEAHRPRREVRPCLEILEARDLLATFTWIGKTSTDWTDKTNWSADVAGATYPGDPTVAGSASDVAVMDQTSNNNDVKLNQTLEIATLDMFSGFTKTLTIQGSNSLTIASGTLSGGTLNFDAAGGALRMDGFGGAGTGNSVAWMGTDINSTGTAHATLYVYNSDTLIVSSYARKLGADLVVGNDGMLHNSKGLVQFAPANLKALYRLNSMVTLYNDASFTIHEQGTVEFGQDVNSDTQGGLDMPASSQSKIANYGSIVRTSPDSDATHYLKIAPPTETKGLAGLLKLNQNTRI